jgi:hypothetical protein
MNEYLTFAGTHPILGTLFLVIAAFFTLAISISIARILDSALVLVNRFIRHWNVRKAGWPPNHLDADGDSVKNSEKNLQKMLDD